MTARRLNRVLAILLILATIVATLSTGAAIFMVRSPGLVFVASQAMQSYPAPVRRALRENYQQAVASFDDDVVAYQAALGRMFEAMAAEPFDRAALDAAMAETRNRLATVQARSHAVLADTIEAAEPAQRAEIRPPDGAMPERLRRLGR